METATETRKKPNVIWRVHPGSQELFLSCPIYECLFEGTRGPGKTDALLMDFAQFVGQGFGTDWKGILFRREYKEFDDLVEKSRKWFKAIFPGAKFLESKGDYRWVFPTGEKLFFRAAKKIEDYDSYHGHGYPWIGWEELTSWPDDELYIAMMSICRSTSPGMPRHYRSTCNPWGIGHHWVKARFIEPMPRGMVIEDEQGRERVAIHGEIWENIHLLENDPGYLKSLQAQSGAKRKAWLEGDWDIVAGGMFDDVWDSEKHIIAPFEIPATWKIDRSFDRGSSKPYSVGFWAESDGCDVRLNDGSLRATQRGDLFRIAEIYGWTGKPNEGTREIPTEIARKIREYERALGRNVNPGPADTEIFTVENGNCIASDMERMGIRWTKANKSPGSRINGWEIIRVRLKNSISREGPGFYVFDTCRQFIRTFPVLPRDKRQADDVDSAAEDHCLHGDTLIVTSKGNFPIKDLVGTEGLVLTAGGYWTEYKNCKLTRKNTEVFRVTFEDDSFIICTDDHKILTAENQWKEVKEWKSESYQQANKNFKVSHITCAETTSRIKVSDFIAKYGNFIAEQSQKDLVSTISTVTEQTTTSTISNSFNRVNIFKSITLRAIATRMYQRLVKRHGYGMEAKKESTGTKNNTINIVQPLCVRRLVKTAGIAVRNSLGAFVRSIARIIAGLHIDAKRGQIISSEYALYAENALLLINIIQTKPAPAVVVGSLAVKRVEQAGFSDVYCLDAHLTHCFVLANGTIVHNCGDETRYRVLAKTYSLTVRQAS